MVDLNRLKNQLASAKVRETDSALFQVINLLIDFLRKNNIENNAQINNTGGTITGLLTRRFITWADESGVLTQSRELLAGSNILFDDTVSGNRIISGAEWSVLTDGDLIEPELIFVNGDVIMIHVP